MKDIMLITIIAMAGAKEPIEQDVTLIVGGFLISGFVISYENYVKHHQTINFIDDVIKKVNEETDKPTDNSPNYIHLRDAKYYHPAGNPIPGNMGIFVRISLESVHGYSFGKLEAGVTE